MSLKPKSQEPLPSTLGTDVPATLQDVTSGDQPSPFVAANQPPNIAKSSNTSHAAAQDMTQTRAKDSYIARLSQLPWNRYLVRGGALAAAISLWYLVSVNDVNLFIHFENVPDPLTVGLEFLDLLGSQTFYLHILHSIERIAIAYLLAVGLGVLLGVMMGRSRLAEDIILPYIELLRPIPAVAWIPLAILMMPSEQSSIVFITFLGALFPIILNTVHGVEQTPKVLVRAARSLGASNTAILWHVVVPGALPSIVAGLSIGMGVAWFSLLAGEIISGQYGIGYFTWSAYTLIEYPRIIIGMLVIGGLGSLCTLLVRKACSPLLRWQTEGPR